MLGSFSLVLLLWYIFPVIVFLASDYIVNTFKLKQKFNIKVPDISVPFLIVGMHEISKYISTFSILPYFLLTIFFLGIGIVAFQAYRFREIMYGRFFKMFWRSTFLMSILLYFILIIVSFIRLIFQ
ncbi:lipoprotein [Enterococcus florum]|uniref:Lipoprotein n=1 Tax=Enterococcus florum TaxID=2480627 RepID=A0A4P5PBX2_9ENTE|nr:lipoprotein [Enterococcus florum]